MPFFKGGLVFAAAYYAGVALALVRGARARSSPRSPRPRSFVVLLHAALPAPGGLVHHVPVLRPRGGGPVHGPPPVPRHRSCPREDLRSGPAPGGAAMNVVIVGNFWFPRGTASAARVRNLALGPPRLRRPRPRDDPRAPTAPLEGDARRRPARGDLLRMRRPPDRGRGRLAGRGANRAPPAAPPPRPAPLVRRLYAATPVALRAGCARAMDRRECDLVVAYDRSALRMAPLARLCRARGVTSVLDVVEVSEQQRGGRLSPLYWDSRAGTRTAPRLFDGLTVISAGLEAAYRARAASAPWSCPALEDWPTSPPPVPTGNDAVPPRLRRRPPAPRRPRAPARGDANPGRSGARRGPRRDGPLRRDGTRPSAHAAMRQGSASPVRGLLSGQPQRRRAPGAIGGLGRPRAPAARRSHRNHVLPHATRRVPAVRASGLRVERGRRRPLPARRGGGGPARPERPREGGVGDRGGLAAGPTAGRSSDAAGGRRGRAPSTARLTPRGSCDFAAGLQAGGLS